MRVVLVFTRYSPGRTHFPVVEAIKKLTCHLASSLNGDDKAS